MDNSVSGAGYAALMALCGQREITVYPADSLKNSIFAKCGRTLIYTTDSLATSQTIYTAMFMGFVREECHLLISLYYIGVRLYKNCGVISSPIADTVMLNQSAYLSDRDGKRQIIYYRRYNIYS